VCFHEIKRRSSKVADITEIYSKTDPWLFILNIILFVRTHFSSEMNWTELNRNIYENIPLIAYFERDFVCCNPFFVWKELNWTEPKYIRKNRPPDFYFESNFDFHNPFFVYPCGSRGQKFRGFLGLAFFAQYRCILIFKTHFPPTPAEALAKILSRFELAIFRTT
jgi:hypothetical protein